MSLKTAEDDSAVFFVCNTFVTPPLLKYIKGERIIAKGERL